jgi:hypothetical protein
LGTIAAATIRTLRYEAIAQLLDARAAAGAGTAALADLLERPGPVVDHGIQVALRGWVTDANQHSVELIMLFILHFVKADFEAGRAPDDETQLTRIH